MAGLGIPPHVVEAVLNHRSGTIRGVAAVYNRYTYAAEKRARFDAWARSRRDRRGGRLMAKPSEEYDLWRSKRAGSAPGTAAIAEKKSAIVAKIDEAQG